MLFIVIDFLYANSFIIINLFVLQIIACLTYSAKDKSIGVLVSCYYVFYILLDWSYFGLLDNFTMLTFDKFSLWYLIQFGLTLIVFIGSLTLFIGGNNSAGLYAAWLLIAMSLDGISSIFQLLETNALLIVYNKLQNISVYVDLFVVFIGMDHIIKRKHRGSRIFIERVNHYLDAWRFISILQCGKGAKCNKKN